MDIRTIFCLLQCCSVQYSTIECHYRTVEYSTAQFHAGLYLWRRTAPRATAGDVDGPALRGHRGGGRQAGRGGRQQHRQADRLRVQGTPRPALLQHALEVSVIPGGRVSQLSSPP